MNNLLITGRPGIGKTTLVENLCRTLKEFRPVGFYTSEIRRAGKRVGFELIGLDGRRTTLAHTDFSGQGKVSKYGVDVSGFEAFLDQLDLEDSEAGFVAIDEIGKMECFSRKFVQLVEQVLSSPKPLIASVAARGRGMIAAVKRRDDVELIPITEHNRDKLIEDLQQRLLACLK